jgi:hypothetical protein
MAQWDFFVALVPHFVVRFLSMLLECASMQKLRRYPEFVNDSVFSPHLRSDVFYQLKILHLSAFGLFYAYYLFYQFEKCHASDCKKAA